MGGAKTCQGDGNRSGFTKTPLGLARRLASDCQAFAKSFLVHATPRSSYKSAQPTIISSHHAIPLVLKYTERLYTNKIVLMLSRKEKGYAGV